MITNKILVLFLLGIALPTFCMDHDNPPVEDGQEWKLPEVSKDLEEFDGRMIAVKLRNAAASGKDDGAPFFALISSYEWKRGHRTYIAHWCVGGHRSWRDWTTFLTPKDLCAAPYFMRRLTLSEAHYLAQGIKKRDLFFYTELNARMKVQSGFRLSDLTPQEQRRYMREHYYQEGELRPLIDDEVAQHGDLPLDMSQFEKPCVIQ